MDFNLTSKNNIGIVGTLILAIFLSQTRTMDFMFRTALGRLTLIVLILAMSYTNKILGVVGVLFVVIICSSSNTNYMEGAENMEPPVNATDIPSTLVPDPATPDPSVIAVTEEPATTEPTSTAVQTKKKATSSASGTPIDEAQTGVTETEDVTTENAGDAINSTENAGVESFDIIGLERNIQKGKNSNSIPIYNNNNSNNILPTDFGMGFNIGFSIF
jgi:hypothetical protein